MAFLQGKYEFKKYKFKYFSFVNLSIKLNYQTIKDIIILSIKTRRDYNGYEMEFR